MPLSSTPRSVRKRFPPSRPASACVGRHAQGTAFPTASFRHVMLRTVLPIFVALSIAIVGGAWSVLYALEHGFGLESLSVGSWHAYPSLGTPDASAYAKASVARQGDLPLGQAEGLVFEATEDASGAALARDCTYRIAGDLPPARFWTLYAADPSMTP